MKERRRGGGSEDLTVRSWEDGGKERVWRGLYTTKLINSHCTHTVYARERIKH